jgi:predicted hotdog family 3-hydroxylacyl-ACP dehydratase
MEAGRVRALVALEYMGQAAAACAGMAARAGGRRPAAGLLLGTRELTLSVSHFAAGDVLSVDAERLVQEGGLASFRCEVRRGEERVAGAVLTVFLPDEAAPAARPGRKDGP